MSPTANTSPSKPTTAKKPASKASGANRASTAGKKQASKPATAAGSTAASTRSSAAAKARANAGTIGTVGSYAQRAVLIPVGAALIARDKLAAGVSELPHDRSTANAKAQAQLRKFERRGTSARNGLEREARRTRVRLERELRKRRGDLDRTVSDLDKRRGSLSRHLTGQVEEASTQIERTVQARVKDVSSLADKVQDRLPGVRRDRAA
jgi:hypothetical protein